MDDKSSDPLAGASAAADSPSTDDASADYELRLRSTERVRLLLQRRALRCSAPRHLVVKIRQSLIVFRSDYRPYALRTPDLAWAVGRLC